MTKKILLLFLASTSTFATTVGPARFNAEVKNVSTTEVVVRVFNKDFNLPRGTVHAKKFLVPSVQEVTVRPEVLSAMTLSAAQDAKLKK